MGSSFRAREKGLKSLACVLNPKVSKKHTQGVRIPCSEFSCEATFMSQELEVWYYSPEHILEEW